MEVKILTLNVRSLRSRARRVALYSYVLSLGVHLVCLQECALASAEDVRAWKEDWSYGPSAWSEGVENRSAGVGILCMSGMSLGKVEVISPGRAVRVEVCLNGFCFSVLNVYASPYKNDRIDLFELLPFFISRNGPFILVGDFNTVLQAEDRKRKRGGTVLDVTSRLLAGLCRDFGLADVWSEVGLPDPGYTWANQTTQSRLDYIFISRHFVPGKAELRSNVFSDHKALQAVLKVPSVDPRGRGVWKLNVSLLKEERVVKSFCKFYESVRKLKGSFTNVFHWWMFVKTQVRMFFMNWGRKVANENKNVYRELMERLKFLYRMRNIGVCV